MTTNNYFIKNLKGSHQLNTVLLPGSNELASPLYFKNFPTSRIFANFTFFKQINGGKLNYSVNGVDVANNINCGAQTTAYSAGTHSVVVPPWCTKVAFVLVGAGGGGGTGGRGTGARNGSGGAGGGSGAVLISNVIPLPVPGTGNLSLIVGSGGLGGVRALRNNTPNNGVNGGTNGGNGGDSRITINSIDYIAGGGGGGQNGYNIADDTGEFDAVPAAGGYGGNFTMATTYRQTGVRGIAASDGVLSNNGSPGTDGAGISVTPVNNYYSQITATGGDGGLKGNNGNNPGLDGSGSGAGGGGGGGSTSTNSDFGGAGGDGVNGVARIAFYP
jgi:hypothetical protein